MKFFTTIPVKPAAVSGPPRSMPIIFGLISGVDLEPLIPTSPLAVTIPSKTYKQPCIYHFLIYTYSFWIQYKIKSVASLHDTRPAPTAAGMLISEAGQRELVEANVPDLGYRATPVVPEIGGKACEKPPRSDLRRSRLDPCSSSPEVVGAPPGAIRHLAESALLLRGMGRVNN
jgi:hypothetical protein